MVLNSILTHEAWTHRAWDSALARMNEMARLDNPDGSPFMVGATHPETYPKFQQQLGRVAALFEMINWCIENPLDSVPLEADDPPMVALQAYITFERRGMALTPANTEPRPAVSRCRTHEE